jgi:hypothetical protein
MMTFKQKGWIGFGDKSGWNHRVSYHEMFYNLDAETLTVHFINKFAEPPALIISPCLLMCRVEKI